VAAPVAILVSAVVFFVVVWFTSTVIGLLRRAAEANERIAAALEEANTRSRAD